MHLTHTSIDHAAVQRDLEERGFSSFGPVLDDAELATARATLDSLSEDEVMWRTGRLVPEPGTKRAWRKINDVALRAPFFRTLVSTGQLADLARGCLGTDNVKLHSTIAWMKPARVGGAKPPHQDAATWTHLVEPRIFTVWLALDEATVENGCMHYLPEATPLAYPHHEDDYLLIRWKTCQQTFPVCPCLYRPVMPTAQSG